jgi:hypothetical protein
MPSTYTLNNGIELIGTGEQSGTWGDTTNTNLGLLDAALDGQVTVALASAGSSGSPNSLPITDGTASNGRNRMVVFSDSGDLGATAYVQLTPNDAEKIIYIRNSLSGSRSVILFQGTYNASNDYEVPAGTTAVVYFDGAGAGAVAANVFNNAYFDGLRLGSVSVTAILDEDNMASDSAAALATQQSIKAYVDSQVGTVDTLAEILAIGNTTGATDIAVDSAQKVQFRDAAIYINSSVDGQLDIVADTEIQIAATTVDLNGALDVSGTLGVTGVLTATSLDISGDIDVDGTTNLDVVDIDGATQIDATVTVGVDDTGYDVKFFGATAGAYMLWDESADDLILGGAAGLSVNSTALVTGVLTTTAATVSNGGGQFNGAINVGVDDTGYDVKFFGATTGKSLLWDESADSLIVTGTTTLVGTTNLDAVDIDGATQIDATVTVGVDDTGYDVKFFGATAGAYMLWDESADDLILGGAAGLSVNSAATIGGTLAVTGVVTANAGVVVDNITIDGQEIDVSSGDLTLDVAGDIILDADGGDVRFKDGGTEFGTIYNTSSNLGIASIVQNKDIIFQGFDDSLLITALTLDMSEAGNARFANDVKLISDSAVITIGVDSDLKITHNGTNGDFESTGDLSFDVVSNIVLDAGGGNVFFNDDDTTFGSATNSSGNLILKSGTTTAATFSGADVTFASNVTAVNSVGVNGGDGMPVLQQAAGSASFPSYSFYGDGDTGMYRISSDFLGFSTGGALRLAIDSDGLKFNGDTAAANALDDYEEGTWTPTFQGDTSNPTATYVRVATYVKVGRVVHAIVYIELTSVSGGSGGLAIGGLPFTAVNTAYSAGAVGYRSAFGTNKNPTSCLVNPNTTKIPLYYTYDSDPRSASTRVQVSDLTSTSQIYVQISYETDS